MIACPAVIGPATCRVTGPHAAHLYVTDPVWLKASAVLEALWAEGEAS